MFWFVLLADFVREVLLLIFFSFIFAGIFVLFQL